MLKIKHKFGLLLKYIIYNNNFRFIISIAKILLGDRIIYSAFSKIEALSLSPCDENVPFPAGVYLMFDGRTLQTGLADNLRSIASVYYECKKQNVRFGLEFFFPFQISTYLEPNIYNWKMAKEGGELQKGIDKACFSYRNVFRKNNENLQKKYIQDVVSSGKSKFIRLYSNTFCHDDKFSESFHELFKPSLFLSSHIQKQIDAIGSKYISISYRFANLLGELKDTYGQVLSPVEKDNLIEKCLVSISEIRKVYSDNSKKILLTADSECFLSKASALYDDIFVIPGPIGHLGHDGEESVVLKTFLDLYMISNADLVIMARTNEMYKSGFAQRAAMIGGKTFVEFLIK